MTTVARKPQTTSTSTSSTTSASTSTQTKAQPADDAVDIDDVHATAGAAAFEGAAKASSKGYSISSNSEGEHMGAPLGPRPTRSTFNDVAAASEALKSDFGVVVAVPADWKPEELARVHESLSRVTAPAEREALVGVQLRRASTPGDAQKAKHPGQMGAFFEPAADVDEHGKRIDVPHIIFYDAAFPGPGGEDGEDRRVTMHVVLHEVGHVLENRVIGDAVAAVKARRVESHGEAAWVEPSRAELQRLAADEDQAKPVRAALTRVDTALKRYALATTPKERAAALAEGKRAQAALDAAVGRLPDDHPGRRAAEEGAQVASDAIAAMERAAQVLAAGDAGNKILDRLTIDNPATAPREVDSKVLADFVGTIGDEHAATTYGQSAPVENFADAYALYRREPALLKKQAPKAYAFMQKHFPDKR